MNPLLEIVKLTREMHPKDCVFKMSDEEIVALTLKLAGDDLSKESIVDSCVVAFQRAELYCPHEGVTGIIHAVMGDEIA